jgi:MFS transporter, SP family, general alpha glucoside:H+ symporter
MSALAEKDALGHVEDIHLDPCTDAQLGHLANQEDHEVGKFASIRRWPVACGWCMYAAVCVLLAAFENQASGSILSIPEFRKDFGYAVLSDGETTYTLSAQWQSAFQGAPVAS